MKKESGSHRDMGVNPEKQYGGCGRGLPFDLQEGRFIMSRYKYATYNTYTDLKNGNRGFANTWEIVRFNDKSDMQKFLNKFENKDAHRLTRKDAEILYRDTFYCVGKKPNNMYDDIDYISSRVIDEINLKLI